MKLRPVSYNWKKGGERELGLLAQDVLKVIPEAVITHELYYNEEMVIKEREVENLGMNYSTLIPILIDAVQEQQKQIEELRGIVQNFEK